MIQAQRPAEPVDVTLPCGRHCGQRPGIRAHRSDLANDEIARLDGIPITSAARTLLDLSSVATPRELERALAFAERERLVTRALVLSLLNRYPGRRGTRRLRALLDDSATPAFTRSPAEEQLLELIRRSGLPEPEMNIMLYGQEVDCFWRNARLVIEVDGYAYHSSAPAFVTDRQRDSAFAAAGIQVVRLTWQQITEESHRTVVQLAQALLRART
jgi:very-short-patch-repair endonuclease